MHFLDPNIGEGSNNVSNKAWERNSPILFDGFKKTKYRKYVVLKGGKVYRKPRISSMTEYKAFDSEFLIKKSLIDNFNLIIY